MDITQTIVTPMMAFWGKLAGFVPNLLAAIAILIVGYFVAKLLATLVERLLRKLQVDSLSEKAGVADVLKKGGIESEASRIASRIIFWLLMPIFLLSAVEALGLERVSATVDDLVLYLPKVVGAVFVIVVGLVIAHFVRAAVRSAAEGVGLDYAKGLGTLVYGTLLVIIGALAVGQLDIETQLLNNAISIILIAVAASVALSLGLGTRDIAGNVIAGVYARDLYKPGATIKLGEISGKLVEVGTTKAVIQLQGKKRITVANRDLINQTVETSA